MLSAHTEPGRFERKMFISDISYAEVEALIYSHPAMFREVFYQRAINNIYLDTLDLKNYWDNISGSGNRIKARVRWYGSQVDSNADCVLELKIKDGLLGWKERYQIGKLAIDNGLTGRALQSAFAQSALPESLKLSLSLMEPTLLNRYLRRYYISQNQMFRLTLDSRMEYLPIGPCGPGLVNQAADMSNLILELKYEADNSEQAAAITQMFPFRITRSSKYVSGVECVRALQIE